MPAPLLLHPAPGAAIRGDWLPGDLPAHVYLHGLSSVRQGEKSDALLRRAIAQGRAFARFDFRGHGASSGEIGRVTLTDLIADATTVLEHTGPGVLVGSSLGGLVAAWTAARRPDLVHALVLLAPAFGFLPRLAAHARTGDGMILVTSEWSEIRLHPGVLEDARRYDEDVLPARLTMPVWIAHGERDEVVPPAASQRVFERIPHARKRLWIVPGGDHRLNREIEAILDQVEREEL